MRNVLSYMLVAIALLALNGCSTVKDNTASTSARFKNVDNEIEYNSNKNQENFKADVTLDPETGKITGLHVETTATTPEAAMAATAKANAATATLLEKLLGLMVNSAGQKF